MISAEKILELRELSQGLTLLYVEDNEGLREKALRVLKKIFLHVISAKDGQEGLALSKENNPDIVITDINMPNMDGLEMIEKIKQLKPSVKFIITSAFDDKDYLFKSIKIGVSDYLKKPVKIDELSDVLLKVISTILTERAAPIFANYMNDMIQYQQDPSALMLKDKPVFVNQIFLDFFNAESVELFNEVCQDFGSLLLKHQSFLYNQDEEDWFIQVEKNPSKLHHVKIEDKDKNNRHFIMKMYAIPGKNDMYIMSLSDITELNLLAVFDSDAVLNDKALKTRETIFSLLNVIHKNNAEIKIYNFYKGLTITSPAIILDINKKNVTIKTSNIQRKAAKIEHKVLLTSDIFPSAILSQPISEIDYKNQTITLDKVVFLPHNPAQRKNVRVAPEDKHMVSLFIEERKFYIDISIDDISIEAVKISMKSLPAGLQLSTKVSIDLVLEHYNKPIIVHTPAQVYRIDEGHNTYLLTLKLDLSSAHSKLLVDYIAKRQMNLIEEFKGL